MKTNKNSKLIILSAKNVVIMDIEKDYEVLSELELKFNSVEEYERFQKIAAITTVSENAYKFTLFGTSIENT